MRKLLTLFGLIISLAVTAQKKTVLISADTTKFFSYGTDGNYVMFGLTDTGRTPIRLPRVLRPDSVRNPNRGDMVYATADSSIYIRRSFSWQKLGSGGGGGSYGLQSVLTTDPVLTANNIIYYPSNYLRLRGQSTLIQAADGHNSIYADSAIINIISRKSQLYIADSIMLGPYLGRLHIDSLNAGATTDSVLVWNMNTGRVGYRYFPSGGGTYTAGNGITLSGSQFKLGGSLRPGGEDSATIFTFPTDGTVVRFNPKNHDDRFVIGYENPVSGHYAGELDLRVSDDPGGPMVTFGTKDQYGNRQGMGFNHSGFDATWGTSTLSIYPNNITLNADSTKLPKVKNNSSRDSVLQTTTTGKIIQVHKSALGDSSTYATTYSVTTSLAGKANTSHTHAASDVTSGTFAIGRLDTTSSNGAVSKDRLTNAMSTKENLITASNTAGRYWNGYKSFVALNSDSITEGTTKKFYYDSIRTNVWTALAGKAATSHTHSASDITSGTFPIGRGDTTSSNGFVSKDRLANALAGEVDTGATYIKSITLNNTGVIHSPTASFSYNSATHEGTLTQSLATQSSYTVLGNHTGSTATPTFGKVSLANTVTGTLPVGNGGTGQTTYTTGDLLYASNSSTLTKLGIGSAGQVLTVGSGLPTWATPSGGGATPSLNDVTNIGAISNAAIKTDSIYIGRRANPSGGTLAIGETALQGLTTGTYNTAIGYQSMMNVRSGAYSTAIGYLTLQNTSGNDHVAIGHKALQTTTSAYYNTAIGVQAMMYNTTGGDNVAIGGDALQRDSTGQANVAIGRQALAGGYAPSYNVAIGSQAMYSANATQYSVGIGYQALYSTATDTRNHAVGMQSMYSTTTGYYNTALGYYSLRDNVSGAENVAVGYYALKGSTGNQNVAVGNQALGSSSYTASNGTALGYNAGISVTSGANNVALGYKALYYVTTGANNVQVGNLGTSTQPITGSNNTLIGSGISSLSNTLNNTLILSTNGNNRLWSDSANFTAIGSNLTGGGNSTLDVRGSFEVPVTSRTSSYTATATDHTIQVTANSVTITLPSAVGISGRFYLIKNSGSGSVTVATTSSQTIDGASTYTLGTQNKYVKVQSDNANWMVVANN